MMEHKHLVFRFADVVVHERELLVIKAGETLPVEPKAFRVLLYLLHNPQKLITKDELLDAVWGDVSVSENSAARAIAQLRRLLGDASNKPRYIATVAKAGYRFICPVVAVDDGPALAEGRSEPERPKPPSTAPLNTKVLRFTSVALAVFFLAAMAIVWQLWRRDAFWQNPLNGAKVERLTDFDGYELDAAISGDGKLAVFSSDRSGQPDVWLTQISSGEFTNITKGVVPGFIFNNGTLRRAGFSGDGSQVWATEQVSHRPIRERTWIGAAIGGVFRPFLEEGLEPAWSPDGSRIVYHTPEAGDPIFMADRNGSDPKRIFTQKPGIHCHFLTWSPDGRYIYFVSGTPSTEEMDIWRISTRDSGQPQMPDRITHHNARVAYLSWLGPRTLIYSATAQGGSGQWLYAIDVDHRIPHRVSSGIGDQYLSVSVSETRPRRLIASVARPSATLWTMPITDHIEPEASAVRVLVPNVRALGPRFGTGYLLFLSGLGDGDGLWRLDNTTRELWKGRDGGLVVPPAIAPDRGQICFSYRKEGHGQLGIMSASGAKVRTLAPALDVRGGLSWSPDGKWIVVAADRGDGTHVFKVPVDGGDPVRLLDTLSYNPVWSPDGKLIVYSEQQGGSRFVLKAVMPDGIPVPLPDISVVYTKATSYRFLPGHNALIVLEGDFRKQNFFQVDLSTGIQRRLTDLEPGFQVQHFDVSPDGKQIVFDRLRDNTNIVLLELAK